MTEDKVDALSLTDDEESEEENLRYPEKKGVLSKWTNYLHGWQDRYIVLKDGTLSYYKSQNDLAFGCRGAVSLSRATITPHQFDECRFDVAVNDSVWYLRSESEDDRQYWIDSIDAHRQSESGYGSESNLRRHGSLLSLASGTSISTASTSSFKRGRGLREKLMEMETFRDILCRQIETLQSYFDSCASAVSHGAVNELTEDDIGDPDDLDHTEHHSHNTEHFPGHTAKDLASILQQHGSHSVDFKGEAFTFKATTAGIIATMSHCIELMSQREDAWKKKLEKEVERRKKYEEAYKANRLEQRQQQARPVIGGPDYEEGPHCAIKEDEFFDAVDASLDKLEKEEESKHLNKTLKPPPKISLSPDSRYYEEINRIVARHIHQLNEKTAAGEDTWTCIAEDGELKVYKREIEDNGIVLDPLKAVHTVTGITGHEVCHHFWDIKVRMDWEGTLDSSEVVEWLSEDSFISHNIIKRVWPASQRDAVFWSHIRHVQGETDEEPDLWIVVNYSIDHDSVPNNNKYVRVTMNVAMVCQTIIEPPVDGVITRDNIKCKISYTAEVNPGGWAPASVLRAVYKREYPKFLKRFTAYVSDATKDKEIMF